MKLTIAVLNYNAGYRLRQAVDSLVLHPPATEHQIVVVDNVSTDGSADFLRAGPLPPRVRFVQSRANLGFTGGYNRAFAESTGEYFMTMNADLAARPGSVDALVRRLDEDPTLGGVAGATVSPKGEFEKYVNRFPTVRDVYLTNFVRREKAERDEGYRRYHMVGEDFSKPIEVPQPAGHLMMVRRSLFPEGLMSPDFCVFWSDVELARKIHLRGRRVVHFPDAPFVHDHDWTRKSATERSLLVDLDWYVGCGRYFRKYEGRRAYAQVKATFGARLLGRLLLVELPAALRGRQTWRLWRGRAALLWRFLADRNVLQERERARERAAGKLDV